MDGADSYPTAEQILAVPEIKELWEQAGFDKNKIENAAHFVAKGKIPNPLLVVLKAASIIKEDKLRIFFSFKFKDENKAQKIVKELRRHSDKVEVTYAAEFSKEIVGEDWANHIKKCIIEADWLILLLPDPKDDWDWCLFEVGAFYQRQLIPAVERLICLHHSEQSPPDQINEFQAVPSTQSKVLDFLKFLFVNENFVPGFGLLRPKDSEEELIRSADVIVNAIQPPLTTQRLYFDQYVQLSLMDTIDDCYKDLEASRIIGSSEKTVRELFGRISTPRSFGELCTNVFEQDQDKRWFKQLASAIREIRSGNDFEPMQATFQAIRGAKRYKPWIQSVDKDKLSGRVDLIHVIFVEDVSALETSSMPVEIQAVASLMRLAFRFRWEVIEPFDRRLEVKDLKDLVESLERIENEAKSRGFTDNETDPLELIFHGEELAYVRSMTLRFRELRNEDGAGLFDRAIREKQVSTVRRHVSVMREMNQEFLKLITKRFNDLVGKPLEPIQLGKPFLEKPASDITI